MVCILKNIKVGFRKQTKLSKHLHAKTRYRNYKKNDEEKNEKYFLKRKNRVSNNSTKQQNQNQNKTNQSKK